MRTQELLHTEKGLRDLGYKHYSDPKQVKLIERSFQKEDLVCDTIQSFLSAYQRLIMS